MLDQVDKKPLPEEIDQLLAPYPSEFNRTLEQYIETPYNDRIRDFYPWGYGWICGSVVLPGQLETLGRGVFVNRTLGLHYSVKDRKVPVVDLDWASVEIRAGGMSRGATLNIHFKGRNIRELTLSWRSSDRDDFLDVVGGDGCLGLIIGRFGYKGNSIRSIRDADELRCQSEQPNTELTFTYRSKALGLAFRQQAFETFGRTYQHLMMRDTSEDITEAIDLGSIFRYVPKEDNLKRDQRSGALVGTLQRYGLSSDPTLSREKFVGATQDLLALIPSSGNFAHPPR